MCGFGAGKGRIEHMLLASGFQMGDRVRSLIEYASQHVVKGDVGTVVGQCSNECADKAGRVCVDFGAGNGQLNILAKSQIEHDGHGTLSVGLGETAQTAPTGDVEAASVKDKEEAQLAAAIAASLVLNQTSSPAAPSVKQWGDGLDAPAAGTRQFVA